MKVLVSLKKRCSSCVIVNRHGRKERRCSKNPKHKARQEGKK